MNTILRLFYDLAVYRDIIKEKFSKTIIRFLSAYLILSSGYSLYISRQYAPQIITAIQTTLATIVNTIPPEATLTISDYRLSTANLPLPFIIDNYIYLDPTAEIPPTESKALVTVGASAVRFLSESNTYETVGFKELELNDLWITGQQIQDQLGRISQQITLLTPYLPVLLAVTIFFGLSIAKMLQALFYALLFLLGVSLTKGHYHFKEIAKITFHTIIVAETLNLAILIVYNNTYPAIFSAAFIGISILAYFNLPARISSSRS